MGCICVCNCTATVCTLVIVLTHSWPALSLCLLERKTESDWASACHRTAISCHVGERALGCTLLTAPQHRPGSKAPNSCKTHSLMSHSVIQSASWIMLSKDSCINPSMYSVTNPGQKYTNLNYFKWILCVKMHVLLIVFKINSDYFPRLIH